MCLPTLLKVLLFTVLNILQTTSGEIQVFSQGQQVSTLRSDLIDEASGLASSRIHANILYIVNDHNALHPENRIFAIQANTGNLVAVLTLEGKVNVDWEDIAVGPCHGNQSCIFIGDTGRGSGHRPANVIYRLTEPVQLREETIRSDQVEKLHFRWNERESECLMVDDIGDVYIVSRVQGGHGLMAKLPFGGWGTDGVVTIPHSSTARLSISTIHYDPRGCDISFNGREMLIKAEDDLYYWRVTNRDYLKAVTTPASKLLYHHEPWGQSVAWSAKGDGLFTVSEGIFEPLYYYQKLSQTLVG